MNKRTRNLEKTRAHIMEAAFLQIYRSGFQGVSVADIVEKTNVTKGAFFHHFPTKQALGYAIVDETLREMVLNRWIRPLAAYRNPVQGILKQLKKIIEATTEETLVFGCPLNNLIQEMSAVDPVFSEKLRSVMEMWVDEVEKYLKKGQSDGYLMPTVNPRQLAEFVIMVHEGVFGMAKSLKDKKVMWSLYDSLREHLNSVSGKSASREKRG